MIPKVSAYWFFKWKNDENYSALISLLVDANDHLAGTSFSKEKNLKFALQKELFDLISRINFTIDSYGYLNFFTQYESEVAEVPRICELLDLFFDDKALVTKSIDGMNSAFKFCNDYSEELKILDDYDHPKYEETYNFLGSKIDFEIDFHIPEIAKLILNNPDDFCVDENGNPINPNYTGIIDTKANGHREIITLKDGILKGEATTYYSDGKTRKIVRYNDGRYSFRVKTWYKSGKLKSEALNYKMDFDYSRRFFPDDYRVWYENGHVHAERIGGVFKKWEEDGTRIE